MTTGHVFLEEEGELRFVGDFDGLYRSNSDPWDQSAAQGPAYSYYRYSRTTLCDRLLPYFVGGGWGLEVGCGHGHVMDELARKAGGSWVGLDISPIAIEQARKWYPHLTFYAGDVRRNEALTPHFVGKFDAVILSQVLWYVLDEIDAAVSNALRFVRPGGLLVVSQAYLKGEQRYGREIANGFRGALQLFLGRYPRLTLIQAHYDDGDFHAFHDGLMIFRKAGAHAE